MCVQHSIAGHNTQPEIKVNRLKNQENTVRSFSIYFFAFLLPLIYIYWLFQFLFGVPQKCPADVFFILYICKIIYWGYQSYQGWYMHIPRYVPRSVLVCVCTMVCTFCFGTCPDTGPPYCTPPCNWLCIYPGWFSLFYIC